MEDKKVRIFIKLTPSEKDRIKERMAEAGTSNMSAFVRKMALNGYIIVLDLSDVKEVLRLLRINSNNLNQYAKKANATGKIYREDIEQLKAQQDEIWEKMKDLLVRLSKLE